MAKKLRLFIQERKFNGDVTKASVYYSCEDAEAQAIVDMSEGVIKVMVEDTAMSSAEGASNAVTGGLPINNIAMVHSESKSKYFGPYGDTPWLFKTTTSVVELQNQFKLHTPYSGTYATEKPDNAFASMSHMGAL
jgi:hypothetical protein